MKNVLVLGGFGFIGRSLTKKLLERGFNVRVFTRKKRECMAINGLNVLEGDFQNRHDVDKALAGVDAVFHLISTTVPKSSNDDPVYDIETNLVGTLHVLNAVVRHKVGKVIFASSGGTVYGIPEVLPVTESHPTNPICSYGIHKLAIEKYLHLYHVLKGIKYTVLRM